MRGLRLPIRRLKRRRRVGQRRLAGRAPEGDPLLDRRPDAAAPDDGAAPAAWLTGPAVDPDLGAAGRVPGRDGLAAFLVRVEQAPGHLDQAGQVGHVSDRLPRGHAAQEQCLGPVDRADPGQVALVEQSLADSAAGRGAESANGLVRVPVRPEQIGSEVADSPVLLAGSDQLDNAELEAGRLPLLVREHQPDPVVPPRIARCRADPPGAVHLEVRMHRDVALDPGEQVLAAGDSPGHGAAGQVGRREPRDPEVAARQHAPGQRLVQLAGRPPDDVTLGHEASIPSGFPGSAAAT